MQAREVLSDYVDLLEVEVEENEGSLFGDFSKHARQRGISLDCSQWSRCSEHVSGQFLSQ